MNEDNVSFMHELRDSLRAESPPVAIAGLTGPRGNAYKPSEAQRREEARRIHAAQVEALAAAAADLLLAATLPAVDEARGIADAMSATRLPYVLSFVLRPVEQLSTERPSWTRSGESTTRRLALPRGLRSTMYIRTSSPPR